MEWTTADPPGCWAPNEIDWDFAQLFISPRIMQNKLRWYTFQFDRTQASIQIPDVFQDTAQMVRKTRWPKRSERRRGGEAAKNPMKQKERDSCRVVLIGHGRSAFRWMRNKMTRNERNSCAEMARE